jgi:hypothetical protein
MSLNRVLAHPSYTLLGVVGSKATALIGVYSAVKNKDVLNMDAKDWFLLSVLYMLFTIASLAAQMLLKPGEKG